MLTARMKEIGKITARAGSLLTERDPTVPAWARQPEKPKYTAGEVGAIPLPAAADVGQVLVVSAVDDAGKPVSWKTEELPTTEEITKAVLAEIPVGDEVAY